MQAGDRPSVQRIQPKQNCLAETQIIDAAGVGAIERPLQIAGIAAGYQADDRAISAVQTICQTGQFAHVLRVGYHAAATGEVGADALEVDIGQKQRFAHHGVQIVRHDAFTQVTQFHHKHHGVPAPGLAGGLRQSADYAEFRVETGVSLRHDAVNLTWHGSAHECHGCPDAGAAHGFDVFNAGITKSANACFQQDIGKAWVPQTGLGYSGDGDTRPAQPCDQGRGIMADLCQINVQPWCAHCTIAPGFLFSCGNEESTMANRSSVGRVSASVTGMPSSPS